MANNMQGDGVSFITDDSDNLDDPDNLSAQPRQDMKKDNFQKKHPYWTEPFCVDDIEDFQTEAKIYDPNIKHSNKSYRSDNDNNQVLQWF